MTGRHGRGRTPDPSSGEFLRIGVEFGDGRVATNLHPRWDRPEIWKAPPGQPSLVEHGTGGSSTQHVHVAGRKLWLWPLPPPEPFELVIQWPVSDIPVTRTVIEGAAVVETSRRSASAWTES